MPKTVPVAPSEEVSSAPHSDALWPTGNRSRDVHKYLNIKAFMDAHPHGGPVEEARRIEEIRRSRTGQDKPRCGIPDEPHSDRSRDPAQQRDEVEEQEADHGAERVEDVGRDDGFPRLTAKPEREQDPEQHCTGNDRPRRDEQPETAGRQSEIHR